MTEAYKFPDEEDDIEIEIDSDNNIEIEIEDDTPVEDRGRQPMPKQLVDEIEQDELDQYSEAAKQRLKQMRKIWHDERREKEAAVRENQGAIELAQRLVEENKKLKHTLNAGETEFVTTVQRSANMEVENAKRAFKEAYEAGDTDQLVEANQMLQDANLKLIRANSLKINPVQDTDYVIQSPQEQPQVATPDRKAMAWQERNPWFGQDQEMTAAALGLHEKLKSNGMDVGSEEYYEALNKTMRKRFTEYFDDPEDSVKPKGKTKSSTVVAPAARTTSSNKIRLKASQIQLAKKLGLTPEQYAKAVLQLENQNGR